VLDESSLFKSWSGGRFKKLDRALEMSNVPYRIALTGTPSPNGEKDLWAQLKLLDGGQRLGAQVGPFTDKYFTTRGNGMIVYEYKLKANARKTIARKISDIVLSLNAKDVDIKLPDVIHRDIILELTDLEREVYDELEREYCIDFFNGESTTIKTSADLINKLLQVSAGAIYEDSEEGKAKVWHELNTVKLDAMANLFDRFPDDNFLIVYQFQHERDRILKRFPDAVSLPKGKKLREVFNAWNRGEIKKLVIHPASAGHGLNIQYGGQHIVWGSPTFNLEHWLQTIARIRRRRGFDKIYVWLLLMMNTEDFRVKKRTESKGTDQQFLMDEVKYLKNKHYGEIWK
jgi:SNF2 family DNA or RNA helicase